MNFFYISVVEQLQLVKMIKKKKNLLINYY